MVIRHEVQAYQVFITVLAVVYYILPENII